MSNTTPSPADFFAAAQATETRTIPTGLTPFMVNGRAEILSAPTDGFYAQAFVNSSGQLIIAYEGSTFNPLGPSGSTYSLHSGAADAQILLGNSPQALFDAVTFAKEVKFDATQQGITSDDIFVTGHSLGGAEAEAAAAATGFGGVTYGAPGIQTSSFNYGLNPSLINYVDNGDYVGNFASDTPSGALYAPSTLNHVGAVVMEGASSNGSYLQGASSLYFQFQQSADNLLLLPGAKLDQVIDGTLVGAVDTKYHLLNNYASDLGLSSDGNSSGLVPTVNNNTIDFYDPAHNNALSAAYSLNPGGTSTFEAFNLGSGLWQNASAITNSSGQLLYSTQSNNDASGSVLANGQTLNYAAGQIPNISIATNGDVVAQFLTGSSAPTVTFDMSGSGLTATTGGQRVTFGLTGQAASVDASGNVTFTSALGNVTIPAGIANANFVLNNGTSFNVANAQSISDDGQGNLNIAASNPLSAGTANLLYNSSTGDLGFSLTGSNGAISHIDLGNVAVGDTVSGSAFGFSVNNSSGQSLQSLQTTSDGGYTTSTLGASGTNASHYDEFGRLTSSTATDSNSGNYANTTYSTDPGSSWLSMSTAYNKAGQVIGTSIFNRDHSQTVEEIDPTTGTSTTLQIDGQRNLVSVEHDPGNQTAGGSYPNYVQALADTLASQLISNVLIKNNLPASAAATAFTDAVITNVTTSGSPNFNAELATSAFSVAGSIAGSDAGVALAKAIGLPPEIGSLAGGVSGSLVAQYLAKTIVNEIVPNTITGDPLSATNFEAGLAAAGGAYIGSQLANLVLPTNQEGQIAGAVATTAAVLAVESFEYATPPLLIVTTFLSAIGADFVGTLIGDVIGDLFGDGYRGRPYAEAHIGIQNGSFVLLESSQDNNGSVQEAITLANDVAKIDNQILPLIGGTVASANNWSIGYHGTDYHSELTAQLPNETDYSDPTAAVTAAVIASLKNTNFSGGNVYMEYAIAASGTSSLTQFDYDLNAARDYSLYVSDPVSFDIALALGTPQQLADWQAELARVHQLGLDRLSQSGSNWVLQSSSSTALADFAAMQAFGSQTNLPYQIAFPNGTSITLTVAQAAQYSNILSHASGSFNETVLANSTTLSDALYNTQTIKGAANGNNTIDFVNVTPFNDGVGIIPASVYVDLTTGTAKEILSIPSQYGSTTTYTFDIPNFQNVIGSPSADTLIAGGINQTLTGNGGNDILVGYSGGQDTFKDAAANLTTSTIQNFQATDLIDITDHAFTAGTSVNFVLTGAGTGVLDVVSGGTTIAQINLQGQFASFAAGSDGNGGILITDPVTYSSAYVLANLAALEAQAAAGNLIPILLSDGGTPTLSVTEAQFNANPLVFGKIISAYNLSVSGVAAGDAVSIAGGAHVTSIAISDTEANILANIAALKNLSAGNQLSSITMTDSAATILGFSQNLFGSGDSDILMRNPNGQLAVYETNGTYHSVAGGPVADKTGYPVYLDGSWTLFSFGQNLLGAGGQDAILQTSAGHGFVLEFNSLGQMVAEGHATLNAGGIASLSDSTLINADGSTVYTNYNTSGSGDWTKGAYFHNAGGQLVEEDVYYTDGSHDNTIYNLSGGPVVSTDNYYLANGQLSQTAVANTDNSHIYTDYNTSGSGGWTRGVYFDNPSWQLTEKDVYYTDGSHDNTAYNLSGGPVADTENRYLASGQLTDTWVDNTDGSWTHTFYNLSGDPRSPWLKTTEIYNTGSQHTEEDIFYTDGSRDVTVYNLAGGSVASTWSHYNAANVLTETYQSLTDGTAVDTAMIAGITLTSDDTAGETLNTSAAGGDIIDVAAGAQYKVSAVDVGGDQIYASSGNILTVDDSTGNAEDWITISNGNVTLRDGSWADIYGGNNSIAAGVNTAFGVQGGNNDAMSAGSGSWIYVNSGTGHTLTTTGSTIYESAGASMTVIGHGNGIHAANGATMTLNGNGDTSDDQWVAVSSGIINITDNSYDDIFGGNNSVTAGQNDVVGVQNGNNNALTAGAGSHLWVNGGSADILTLNGSGGSVTLNSGVSNISITASHATINAADGDMFNLTGSNDTVYASNGTLYLNASTANITINGNNETVHVQAGATYNVTGTNDTVVTNTVVNAQDGTVIANYDGIKSLIDVTNLSYDSSITATFVQNSGGYAAQILVSDHGSIVNTIDLQSVTNLGGLTVRPDGSGGTLLVDPPLSTGNQTDAVHQAFADAWSELFGRAESGAPSFHDHGQQFNFSDLLPNTLVASTATPRVAIDHSAQQFDFSSLSNGLPAMSNADMLHHDLQLFSQYAAAITGDLFSPHQLPEPHSPLDAGHQHGFMDHLAPSHGWHL